MPVTMRDVAARAGVSLKTVSRVVNDEPHIRAETQQRVRVAIDELGWTPNASARTLRTGRTGVVAIAVPGLRSPLLAALVEALVTEVDRHGLHAAVEPTRDEPDRWRAVLDEVGRSVDAVLAVDAPHPVVTADGDPPVAVRVDVTRPGEPDDGDRVHADLDLAADLVLRHLGVMGRTRPVQLGSGPLRSSAVPAVPLAPAQATRAGGRDTAAQLLAAHPEVDAIVCGSDEIALGVLSGLHAAGVDVPGRVAVVGYGGIDDGWFSTPSLTTIDVDLRHLAREAVDLVVARLAGVGPGSARAVAVPVALLRRESTLGAGAP